MAGNPFRRKEPSRVSEAGDETLPGNSISTSKGKVVKRVVIQSPPDSPEDVPHRLSSGRVSPPPPPPPEHPIGDSDSDSTATADSDLEQASRNTRRNSGSLQPGSIPGASASGAPFNPFARTLATSEASFGLQRANDGQERDASANGGDSQRPGGRPAMGVDEFKNILMTGSAAPPAPAPQPPRFDNGNSSTDVSSRSQNSMFDPYFELIQETPRTSLDMMGYDSASEDDEEGSSLMSGSERLDDFAPPAPPKNTKRKPGPQTVSFADFAETITSPSQGSAPPASVPKSSTLKPHVLHRSPSDLNKPLPPPPQDPADASNATLDVPTAAIPDPESTPQNKKVPPPPPPASRRAGQSTATQNLGRSPLTAKSASTADETTVPKVAEPSSKSGPAPPPPPARKSRPLSQSAAPSEIPPEVPSPAPSTSEAKSAPMPPPPPRRNPSKAGAGTSVNRTPSTASRSSARKENQPTSNLNAPAPPPPRRGGNKRESMDGPSNAIAAALSGRLSNEMERRGSEISVDSGKLSTQRVDEEAEPVQTQQPASPSSTDILADMNALQAEIDALRARAGRG